MKDIINKPYNPENYGLPIWRDEDHLTPQQIAQKNQEITDKTKEALQLLWDNINKLYQRQLYKRPEIKRLLDQYNVK